MSVNEEKLYEDIEFVLTFLNDHRIKYGINPLELRRIMKGRYQNEGYLNHLGRKMERLQVITYEIKKKPTPYGTHLHVKLTPKGIDILDSFNSPHSYVQWVKKHGNPDTTNLTTEHKVKQVARWILQLIIASGLVTLILEYYWFIPQREEKEKQQQEQSANKNSGKSLADSSAKINDKNSDKD